jgi:hypothetical protein
MKIQKNKYIKNEKNIIHFITFYFFNTFQFDKHCFPPEDSPAILSGDQLRVLSVSLFFSY